MFAPLSHWGTRLPGHGDANCWCLQCQPNTPSAPNGGSGDRCRACARTGAECLVPAIDERKLSNSKKLVRELYARIESLEAELREHRAACPRRDCVERTKTPETGDELVGPCSPGSQSDRSGASDNMIIRLCG